MQTVLPRDPEDFIASTNLIFQLRKLRKPCLRGDLAAAYVSSFSETWKRSDILELSLVHFLPLELESGAQGTVTPSSQGYPKARLHGRGISQCVSWEALIELPSKGETCRVKA